MGYYGWSNLGDSVQTYALSRLLPTTPVCRFRDDLKKGLTDDHQWIINGFFHHDWRSNGGSFTPNHDHTRENLLYAGIHIGESRGHFKGVARPIGARDSYTQKILQKDGIPVEWCGCVTSTLERYTGPRSGTLHIESPERSDFTQNIPYKTPWKTQWDRMLERLDQIRTAECVITKRLHVAIPCLAFGTPVKIPWESFYDMEHNARMSVLDDYGFEFDKFNEIDMTPFANRYKEFLYSNLGISDILPSEKPCPEPI